MSKTLSEEIDFALCCISECCVDESKRNITSRKAVEQIREYLNVLNDDRYSKHFNISLKRELREKDQRIAELEKQLAIRDKALELAVREELNTYQFTLGATVKTRCSEWLEQAEEALKKAEGK